MYSIILDLNGIFRGIGKGIESSITSKKTSSQIKCFENFPQAREFNLHISSSSSLAL